MASLRQREQVYGPTAVGEFLNPTNGYRGRLIQRGLQPKNHALENRRALREKQKENRIQQQLQSEDAIGTRHQWKMEQFRNIKSKVDVNGTQHLSPVQLDDGVGARKPFLKKGAHRARLDEARTARNAPPTPRKEAVKAAVPRSNELSKVLPRRNTNFVVSNRSDAVNMEVKRVEKPKVIHRHSEFGSIPRYIMERREHWAAEEKRKRDNSSDPDCPPGLIVMPDEERLETLEILKQSEKETHELLHRLPLTATTERMIKRKEALESKLKEIESAKHIFMKPRVFVKP